MDWDTVATAVWQVLFAPIDYLAFGYFLAVRLLWGVYRQRRRLQEFMAANADTVGPCN
jgi:hypothetical protein